MKIETDLVKLLLFVNTFWVPELSLILCWKREICVWSPRGGSGNPPQYSCLENSMDKGTWWATVHGVTKNQMRLSDWAHRGQITCGSLCLIQGRVEWMASGGVSGKSWKPRMKNNSFSLRCWCWWGRSSFCGRIWVGYRKMCTVSIGKRQGRGF